MIFANYDQIDNCSTIIVGKNASATGKVLLAHNEDDMNCIVQTHVVPAMDHKEGEVLTFEDGDAVIPQVPHTLKYLWSDFRCPGGEAFADGYANECGVVVVSNACIGSKVSDDDPQMKGIGYGLRRIIAERAHTAREGVLVAAEMLTKYGYRSSRSYAIVDKDEGWFFQATTGNNFVAQRVGDDEVAYIPNWYTIHNVDFSDTEHKNFYWSETLTDYVEKHGWYTPKTEDKSDFDFALAYNVEGSDVLSNRRRSDLAWTKLTGEAKPYRTFSVKAEKVYTLENMKAVLRSHYVELEDDLKTDPTMSPHRYGICRDTTVESLVIEFTDNPDTSVMWRAAPRPCCMPYMPWFFGTDREPYGYSWNSVKASQDSHLHPDEDEFRYHRDRAYWAFHALQNMMEFDYQFCQDKVHSDIAKMEAEWAKQVPEIISAYNKLAPLNSEYAKNLITDYTCQQAQKVWDWALQTTCDLADMKNKARMDFWRSKL